LEHSRALNQTKRLLQRYMDQGVVEVTYYSSPFTCDIKYGVDVDKMQFLQQCCFRILSSSTRVLSPIRDNNIPGKDSYESIAQAAFGRTCFYHYKGLTKYVAVWDVDEIWTPPSSLHVDGHHNYSYYQVGPNDRMIFAPDSNETATTGLTRIVSTHRPNRSSLGTKLLCSFYFDTRYARRY
jgi:hypothetical protein